MDFINQLQIPGAVVQIVALVAVVLVLVFGIMAIVFAVKRKNLKVKLDSAKQVNEGLQTDLDYLAETLKAVRKEASIVNSAFNSLSSDNRELKDQYEALQKESDYLIKMKDGTIAKLRKDLCERKGLNGMKKFYVAFPGVMVPQAIMADSIRCNALGNVVLHKGPGQESSIVAILPPHSTVICEENIVREPDNQVSQ